MITALQAIVFLSYIAYLYNRVGILSSISASSYALKKPERYLFYAFCSVLGFLNLFQGMGPWGFFTGAFMCFSGVTLDHEEELTGKVHVFSTLSAVLFALVGLWVVEGMKWPLIIAAIGSGLSSQVKNSIWWGEVIIITIVLIAYIIR